MTSACKHGFPTEQCAACRTCPHGLTAGGCGRCSAATAAATRRRVRADPAAESSSLVAHEGFEIYYAPEVSGWQFRGPESVHSTQSYRSVFLARKAIDELPNRPRTAD